MSGQKELDELRERERLAYQLGGGSVKTIETTGRANVAGVAGWEWVVANMATVPCVSLGLGSVAGRSRRRTR